MIFFCEDCGARNSLKPEHIISKRAKFRCSACGYSNDYLLPPASKKSRALPGSHKTKDRPYDFLLDEINKLPKIIGSFIYHYDKGLIEKRMPEAMKKGYLVSLAKLLSKNYVLCRKSYPDIHGVTLFSINKIVMLKPLKKKSFVVVVGKSFPLPQILMVLMKKIQKQWQL